MGRKKYFAALAAAGMIGAMALGSAFNSYAADGWTKSNDHWTYIYQGKTYTLSSPMAVVTAPAAKAESGSTTIVPTTMDQEITPFDFPAAFPGIGGNKFTCWMPTFPILFDFSFAGYVLFGGGYKPASYMNDSGNPDPEYWKKSPRESGAK